MRKNMYKFFSLLLISSTIFSTLQAKPLPNKLRALFIGNSYTATNVLPLLVRDVAFSVGDTLITDWVAPGGFTFEQHAYDPGTQAKIAIGNWNYVVLQEQSQRPAFSDVEVMADVYPFAERLDSLVHDLNKCGRSIFFQTWGYKNGDALNCPTFPPICTYNGMDSLLQLRYQQMAIDNDALLSPVGLVFREIRKSNPGIELYQIDESHPSEAGSYAAAVTFYTILFRKNPILIPFNYSVLPSEAVIIRQIVHDFVFNDLGKFHVGDFEPIADFSYMPTGGNSIDFSSATSDFVDNYNWDFGDGGKSTLANPSHTYAAPGTYTVRLIGDNCSFFDTTTQSVMVGSSSILAYNSLSELKVYPNPASNMLFLESVANLKSVQFSISNLLGSVVLENTKVDQNSIDITTLSTGVYILKLIDKENGATITRKFIKE